MLEVCQQIVRWVVSYKASPFSKKLEIRPEPRFHKMFKKTWGGPPRTPRSIFKFGPGPIFGPMFWVLYLLTGPGPVLY